MNRSKFQDFTLILKAELSLEMCLLRTISRITLNKKRNESSKKYEFRLRSANEMSCLLTSSLLLTQL